MEGKKTAADGALVALARAPGNAGEMSHEIPGDAAAVLSVDGHSDALPVDFSPPPWQRSDPLTRSRAMVLTLRSDRALAYQPYLPPPEFWDERTSAGLQVKAKA